jgi:putative ABC transport system ATP-binding protein/lipoprotein-releasing system ATP-binding protein
VIESIGVGKKLGFPPVSILRDVSLKIEKGEFVSLTGKSGSGKSSLLYILSSLDRATEGKVLIDHCSLADLPEKERARFRNRKIGFVFQFHYLISELTALENVLLPARKCGEAEKRKPLAHGLLAKVGLGSKMHRLPRQLSGGEQQRVAIARALIMNPEYLFADEPTGALDSVNGQSVMEILRDANRQMGTTILLVTHDPDFANLSPRRIHLVDGEIVGDVGSDQEF